MRRTWEIGRIVGWNVALLLAVLVALPIGCAPPSEPKPDEEPAATDTDGDTADQPAPHAADEPTADTPADDPTADEPADDEPAVDEPAVDEPAVDEPTADTPAEPAQEAMTAIDPAEAANMPMDVPVSKFAPAAMLVEQVDEYVEDVGKSLEEPDEFESEKEQLSQHANTLVVLALAVGLHDQDNQLKAHAPAIVKAAQEVAAAEDYEAAQAAFEQLKKAVEEGGDGPELKWEKVASMPALMKEVPSVNSTITRNVKRRFDRRGDKIASAAAVIAVIGQGSIPNAEDTIEPEKTEEWEKYCLDMRNAAAQLIGAVQAQEQEIALEANEKLQQSCHDCHEIFHPEEVN